MHPILSLSRQSLAHSLHLVTCHRGDAYNEVSSVKVTLCSSYVVVKPTFSHYCAQPSILPIIGAKCYNIELNIWKNKCIPYWAGLPVITPWLWPMAAFYTLPNKHFWRLKSTQYQVMCRDSERGKECSLKGVVDSESFNKVLLESQGHIL